MKRRAPLASLAALLATFVLSLPARADGLRPPDAPRISQKSAEELPKLPPEYHEVDLDGIRICYHPSTRERIRSIFDRAGAIRASLATAVGAEVLHHVEVRIAAVPAEMVQLSPGEIPASATSVAFFEPRLETRLVVMSVLSASPSPIDVEAAFTHALAHIALDEATGGADVPPWFHEGFAVNAAEGGGVASTRALVDAAIFGRFLTQDELAHAGFQGGLGDAQAGDFIRFLEASRDARTGHTALANVLERIKGGAPFERAVPAALGAPDRAAVEARWGEDRARRYAFVPVLLVLLGAGGIAAGILLGVGRSRRAREVAEPSRARAPSLAKTPRSPAKFVMAARLAAGRGKDAAVHIPRDPEVPKVEHDGEWHTLH